MSGNNKPAIVFINHWAASLGGAEYSLADIMETMSSRASVHLITTETGPLVTMAQNSNVTCHVLPSSPSLLQVKRKHLLLSILANIPAITAFCRYIFAVRSCIITLKPYCIHANVPKSHITLFILRLFGIRCRGVIHFREIFSPHSSAKALYHILYFLAKGPDVIAISKTVQDALPHSMRKRSVVIYNGVSIISSCRKQRTHPPVRFLYLGRVVPWKGCDFLINSFLHLINKYHKNNAHLSIIGNTSYWDSTYRDTLLAIIENNNASELITLQEHSDARSEILAAHDVLCLPSLAEPFGRVAAEALGSEMPVIAWQSGALPEVITHNETGILAPVNNIDAFVKAMKFFIDQPDEIKRMGHNGGVRAKQLFNRDIQLPLIADYLASL